MDAAVPADPPVEIGPTGALAATVPSAAAPAVTLPPAAPAEACTVTEATPQLEPEALGTMNVRSDDPDVRTAAAAGYDGSGVTVGVVTTPGGWGLSLLAVGAVSVCVARRRRLDGRHR